MNPSGAEAFATLLQQRRQQLSSANTSTSNTNVNSGGTHQAYSYSLPYTTPAVQNSYQPSYFPAPLPKQPPPPPVPLHHLGNPAPSGLTSHVHVNSFAQPYLHGNPYYYTPPQFSYQQPQNYLTNIPFAHSPALSFPSNYSTPYPSSSQPQPHSTFRVKQKQHVTNPALQQEYFCEPCDKSFRSEVDYKAHCNTHEKCPQENCNFTGSKKVVNAHFHAAHGKYHGSGYKVVDVEGQKFKLLLGYSPEEIEQWKNDRKAKFPTKNRIDERMSSNLTEVNGRGTSMKRKQHDNEKVQAEKKRKTEDRVLSPSQANQDTPDKKSKQKGSKNRRNDKNSLRIPKPLTGGDKGSLLKKLLEKEIFYDENLILQCITFISDSNFFDEVKSQKSINETLASESIEHVDSGSSDSEDGETDTSEEINTLQSSFPIDENNISRSDVISSLLTAYASSEEENEE